MLTYCNEVPPPFRTDTGQLGEGLPSSDPIRAILIDRGHLAMDCLAGPCSGYAGILEGDIKKVHPLVLRQEIVTDPCDSGAVQTS